MSPGFSELNLNKKIRGAKKPNLSPVITREDAKELLAPIQLTKRIVVSKISELYDPVGLFEPIKLQYKLEMRSLSGLGWDEEIIDSEQQKWKDLIAGFVDLEKISIPRCAIPSDSESVSKIRLICLSDAAEYAGGAAVYGGRKLIDGSWSFSLITAKSKLLNGTIPQIELSAIMLMTEVAFIAKKSLGSRVDDIIFVTDSTIALCWVHNENKRLRIFVLNRVEKIRRMINWTTETETIPLFHIDGSTNIADLLTKHHDIGPEDVSTESEWQEGKPWMRLNTEDMPLKRYQDLTVSQSLDDQVRAECYDHLLEPSQDSGQHHAIFSIFNDEVFVNSAAAGRLGNSLIVDPIHHGWFRAIRILQNLLRFIGAINHRRNHTFKGLICHICNGIDVSEREAEKVLLKYETATIKNSLKPEKLKQFGELDGILYY